MGGRPVTMTTDQSPLVVGPPALPQRLDRTGRIGRLTEPLVTLDFPVQYRGQRLDCLYAPKRAGTHQPGRAEHGQEYGERTRKDVRKQNDDAIAQMKKRGLNIVDPADVSEWHKVADDANTVVRGKVVPAAIYDQIVKLRDEYRAQHKR